MEPAEIPDSGPACVSGQAGAAADTIFGAGCACCRNSSAAANLPGCRGPVRLLNTSVCPITQQQSVAIVLDSLRRGQGGWIVTPNLDHVRRCSRDPRYAETVLNASLRLADGMPLVWASRLQRTPVPERVPGSDLIYSLSRALAAEGRSIYLLGGEPGTAEAAAQVLGNLNPGLRIAGTCCPPLGFEQQPEELRSIRSRLVAAKPDLVFVALGSPKQEYLIQSLRLLLPTTWWVGVGISFSFVCGRSKGPRNGSSDAGWSGSTGWFRNRAGWRKGTSFTAFHSPSICSFMQPCGRACNSLCLPRAIAQGRFEKRRRHKARGCGS